MPIYEDSSESHPDQGMTLGDMRACELVAARRNEVIMFRSTGPWSRPHIEAGHPTKPFHVKGKSSTWGPHAGFVPLDSQYSKAVSAKDIDKGRALNAHAIKGNFARPVRLFLTEAYINQYLLTPRGMTSRPAVDRLSRPREGVMYFFCRKPDDDDRPGAERYVFLGKRHTSGAWEIFAFSREAAGQGERNLFLQESAAEPLMVLAVPGSEKPITGDYDLFAVCPSWAEFGGKDRKLDPTLDDARQNASQLRTAKKAHMVPQRHEVATVRRAQESLAKLHAARTPEDPDRGNLTPRIFELVVQLNAAMGAPYGPGMMIGKSNVYKDGVVNQRVHHNAESGRPFAPGAEDGFPLTTFHPGPVGPYRFRNATINDIGDLRGYFNAIFAAGYYVPRNRAWNMPSLNPLLPGYRAQ